jgi:[ribosomal protein S5]-alanine N-acetyltransferase
MMLTISFQPFPLLNSPRLLLREINMLDSAALYYLRSNAELMRYVHRPLFKHLDEVTPFLQIITQRHQANEDIMWAICLRENPEALIGTIGFWRMEKEHHRAEIGYMLSDKHQNKGIMKEALQTILAYGFNVMKLNTAEAQVNPDNESSWHLLEKVGFIREAFFKENFLWQETFHDTFVYSMSAKEYRLLQ